MRTDSTDKKNIREEEGRKAVSPLSLSDLWVVEREREEKEGGRATTRRRREGGGVGKGRKTVL